MENAEKRKRTANILRIIARIIGVAIVVFFLAIIIGDAVQSIQSEDSNAFTGEALFILIPIIIALAAFVLSWWYEFIGGVLLVAAYFILSFSPALHSVYYGPQFRVFAGMFAFASPFLIVGVLLIIASRITKRTS
jgi:hypothetical protein